MTTGHTGSPFRIGWLSAAACAGVFVFGIVMALLGAILPVISERIGFDLRQAGNLFLGMNFAMLVSMLSLGPLMDRFGKKGPLVAGSVLVALALLTIAHASRYAVLLYSVFLLGAGGGALNAGTNTLMADLASSPQRKASALNVLGLFYGFGALCLPFIIASLLSRLGLIRILYIAVGLSLVPLVLFIALAFPPARHEQGFPWEEAKRLARNRLVLLLGLLLFFQSGSEFIAGGYVSTYLTRDVRASMSAASYILGGYWASLMIGRAISSRLLLRVKGTSVVLLSSIGSVLGGVVLLTAPNETLGMIGVVILGLSFASIFPTTLGFAGSRFEAYSGTVFGILFAIALTGGMTLPWAVGQLAQAYGLRSALMLLVVNPLMIFVLQLSLGRSNRES